MSGEKHSHGLLEVGVRVLSGKWQAIGAVGRPGWGVAAVVGLSLALVHPTVTLLKHDDARCAKGVR